MKLCFVSVNGPREPYLLDETRIKLNVNSAKTNDTGLLTLTIKFIKGTAGYKTLYCIINKIRTVEKNYKFP
jgi:hypothetical protein